MSAVIVTFADGYRVVGETATDWLEAMASKDWNWNDDPSTYAMKSALSDRAFAWSGAAIDPLLSDDDFLTALGESGLCFVRRGGRDPWQK